MHRQRGAEAPFLVHQSARGHATRAPTTRLRSSPRRRRSDTPAQPASCALRRGRRTRTPTHCFSHPDPRMSARRRSFPGLTPEKSFCFTFYFCYVLLLSETLFFSLFAREAPLICDWLQRRQRVVRARQTQANPPCPRVRPVRPHGVRRRVGIYSIFSLATHTFNQEDDGRDREERVRDVPTRPVIRKVKE
jgi:hypothetical protein